MVDIIVQGIQDVAFENGSAGADGLAVGIGNAHGFYKAPPKLNIQRLREIQAAVDVPLVLHGGTGLPEEQVRACIESGISKVNAGTLLHSTYLTRQRLRVIPKNRNAPCDFDPSQGALFHSSIQILPF